MSEQRTVVLSELSEKTGETNGRAWHSHIFKDANGDTYSTFDAAVISPAVGKLGQRFTITFDTNARGYKNLTAVEEAPSGTGGGEAPDWDEIGLRKTRCALWAAFLGGEAMAEIIRRGEETSTDLLIRIGTRLVAAAENDIFERVHLDDGIPFEVNE